MWGQHHADPAEIARIRQLEEKLIADEIALDASDKEIAERIRSVLRREGMHSTEEEDRIIEESVRRLAQVEERRAIILKELKRLQRKVH